jgi:hypothetical protein
MYVGLCTYMFIYLFIEIRSNSDTVIRHTDKNSSCGAGKHRAL